MAGLYIHIPFCSSRCAYCGFFSTTMLQLRQEYVDAMCREMQIRKDFGIGWGTFETIYLGGGTPSQLSPLQLRQLLDSIYNIYNVSAQAEVTIECNPDDIDEHFAACLSEMPFNRVSLGAQSFNDKRLRFIRRRHTASQVRVAVETLRKAGISNISVDLMYGFPDQTIEEWHQDIDAVLQLDVQHISAYALSYEEGTPLYKMLKQNKIKELDEELQRQMYYDLKDRLEAAEYEHYEISNFARKGYRSRHNSGYWNHTPYLGLGAGAHSYFGNIRSWNVADITEYIESIKKGTRPYEQEILDENTIYNEDVMTQLRKREGLPLNVLSEKQREYCSSQAHKYIESGLLSLKDACLRLTRNGLFVSDMVMADLMI